MILDDLTLLNFGIYRGRQKIDLSPPAPDKPVVLIGALNGGGKTTLLDALQLVFFGKRARCSNRGELAYEDFLRRAIHRHARPSEGAGLELTFRHWTEGRQHVYRIRRFWADSGRGVSEHLEVLRDGVLDRILTESWNEAVEEFIPHGIANLFLFDGEKIESLAEPATARQVFATAIHSLLGIDVLDQLSSDLVVLERKRKANAATGAKRAAINELELEVHEQQAVLDRILQERSGFQTALEHHGKRLVEAEERLRAAGGDLYAQRALLESEQRRITRELSQVDDELRLVAEGPLAFQLLNDLLREVLDQGERELAAERDGLLLQELETRDALALRAISEVGGASQAAQALASFLKADRERRSSSQRVERFLGLDAGTQRTIQALLENGISAETARARAMLARHAEVSSELVDCERRLTAVPDEGAIAALTADRNLQRERFLEAEGRLQAADELVVQARTDLERKQGQLVTLIEGAVEEELERETAVRLLEHARKVRDTLGRFRNVLLERHLSRISRLVNESYQRLMRKQSLIGSVKIDPKTFDLHLYSPEEQLVPTERLSAGERQLLATSMLWGLAMASGRPLPAVIDTPLGRLDSIHRTLLVERYFPFASHQVLILSTDEEIDRTYYPLLEPWIGRTYHLRYDEAERFSSIHPGYFW